MAATAICMARSGVLTVYGGNKLGNLRPALPKKLPVGALDTRSPLPRFAFNRLDDELLVLHWDS